MSSSSSISLVKAKNSGWVATSSLPGPLCRYYSDNAGKRTAPSRRSLNASAVTSGMEMITVPTLTCNLVHFAFSTNNHKNKWKFEFFWQFLLGVKNAMMREQWVVSCGARWLSHLISSSGAAGRRVVHRTSLWRVFQCWAARAVVVAVFGLCKQK